MYINCPIESNVTIYIQMDLHRILFCLCFMNNTHYVELSFEFNFLILLYTSIFFKILSNLKGSQLILFANLSVSNYYWCFIHKKRPYYERWKFGKRGKKQYINSMWNLEDWWRPFWDKLLSCHILPYVHCAHYKCMYPYVRQF